MPSTVTLLPELDPDIPPDLAYQSHTPLLGSVIVNPMGPTLTLVQAVGELRPHAIVPLIHCTFNPFTQDFALAGEMNIGEHLDMTAVLPGLFGLPFGGYPSLVLVSTQLSEADAVNVCAAFLQQFDDARSVLRVMEQHPDNGSARLCEVMEGMSSMMAQGSDTGTQNMDASPLTEAEATRMATQMLAFDYVSSEAATLLQAWQGAISFQEMIGTDLAADALETPVFDGIFSQIVLQCRFLR